MDKKYDLEERTFLFAQAVRTFAGKIKITLINQDDLRQLLKSSGSVGANFIEANEALSKKDFYYRVKVCRKEAKESRYWLRLLVLNSEEEKELRDDLLSECLELQKIFGAIVSRRNDEA
jgi:four helix bundle protein